MQLGTKDIRSKTILLSFDVEEFDVPTEYGKTIPFHEQISISAEGTKIILDILKEHSIKATFFSTAIFASHALPLIKRIIEEGHELASHGYFHSQFKNEHLLESKQALEKISGKKVTGFRIARMMPVDDKAIQEAGYTYNSSLNPTYLPGRYNNFFKPRTFFHANKLIQIPASVTPIIRLPLFWLSFHHLPQWLYRAACLLTIKQDHYLNIYFHPWEFTNLSHQHLGLPSFISRNSGTQMVDRFQSWIAWMKNKNYFFITMTEFVESLDQE